MSSISDIDAAAAEVAKAPRVSEADMNAKIKAELYGSAALLAGGDHAIDLSHVTLCVLVMENGYVAVGSSAPASPENFDVDLGSRLAKEDALREVWKLEGYALRTQLAAEAAAKEAESAE